MIRIKATASRLENALVYRDRSGVILARITEDVKMDLRSARTQDIFKEVLTIIIFEMEGLIGDDMTQAERTFVENRLLQYVWSKP